MFRYIESIVLGTILSSIIIILVVVMGGGLNSAFNEEYSAFWDIPDPILMIGALGVYYVIIRWLIKLFKKRGADD
jgi:hypothetical protein